MQTVRVRGRYRANNAEAVACAALAGLGVALLPVWVCAEDLAAGLLLRVLPDSTRLAWLRLRSALPPARARRFRAGSAPA